MSEVSVLMTVYNGMPYIRQAVQSILDQTLTEFEFIIVDDGSNDETPAFLASLKDPRVQIVTQANGGTAAAANHGLEHVTTPFVARFDADDICMPDRLEKQLEFLKANPEVGLVGTQVANTGDAGTGKSLNLPLSHEDIFDGLMSGRHALAHSSLMMRTSVLKGIGGYWKLRITDDWDMMVRMGEVSKLRNLDYVGMHYRVHTGSLNGASMKKMHRSIRFAIECGRRRQSDLPSITYEEFVQQLESRPLLKRVGEACHIHAMANYRVAVAEILGGKRFRGYVRMGWAALCSPSRTFERVARVFKGHPSSASSS